MYNIVSTLVWSVFILAGIEPNKQTINIIKLRRLPHARIDIAVSSITGPGCF